MNLEDVILRGTRAGQPAANTVPNGTLYFVTDEAVTERSTGAAWQTYTDGGSAAITSLTGDVTGTGPGATATTIGNNKVLDTMIRQSAAVSVIGRSANSTGNVADIAAGANDRIFRRVADVLDFGQLTVGMFPDAVVSYAKIQDVSAASKLLGRGSAGGAGDVEEISLGTGLSMSGTTLSSSAASASWQTKSNTSISGVNHVDFTALSSPTDIQILLKGITFSSSDEARVRVSTDDGATFLTGATDYVGIQGNGVEVTANHMRAYVGAATAARSGAIWVGNCNATTPKVARSNFFSTDGVNLYYIPTSSAINAIQIFSNASNNFSGGAVYVYYR